jgi:hypothetical protein
MLRSVGALIFGTVADRYGRKWPMIINLGFFVIFELGSGFCQNLSQFLALRCLYGIAMGGLSLFPLLLAFLQTQKPHRTLRPCRSNSTRRSSVRSPRSPLRTLRTRLCNRLPPRRDLLPRSRSHYISQLAQSLLVRFWPTDLNHDLPILPP